MIGMGFAGVGALGEALIRDLAKFPTLKLAAVQDARPETAARIAEEYGAMWHGVGFEALLGAPGVDAVAISTPNALHVPQAQAALRAGKHVLVQKPLALSCADAEATLELARRVDRLLFVDYTYRFLDTIEVLHRRIERPSRIRAEFHNIYGPGSEKAWFFDAKLSGGGALTDLGVHLLDLAFWLLQPRVVRLDSVRLTGEPIDHAAELRLLLDDTRFDLAVSWNAQLAESVIRFEADDVRWENVAGNFFRFRTVLGEQVVLDRETTLREDTLRAFCHALESNAAPPIDARVYAVLDQAYARTGG